MSERLKSPDYDVLPADDGLKVGIWWFGVALCSFKNYRFRKAQFELTRSFEGMFEFIKSLFSKKPVKRVKDRNTVPPIRSRQHAYVDDSARDGDLMQGYEFVPTLHLKTPRKVLERRGEIFNGKLENAPTYGNENHGVWVPKLAADFDFMSKNRMSASDAGTVNPSEYVKFAVSFKKAVSESRGVDQLLAACKSLEREFPVIYQALEESYKGRFPVVVAMKTMQDVYQAFAQASDSVRFISLVEGVTPSLAQKLWDAGIVSIAQLKNTEDETLLAIPGVGKGSVARIRTGLASAQMNYSYVGDD